MNQKRIAKWRGGLLLLVMIAMTVVSCNPVSDQSAGNMVGTGVVVEVTSASAIEASGTVDASQQANLTWKTTGQVDEVLVNPGDTVDAGDVLMTLLITSAPANVVAAQADQINAQQALDDLLTPSTQMIAVAEKSLADAHIAFDNARADLETEMSRARSGADSSFYDAFDSANNVLDDAQEAFPLATADITEQAYYRAALVAENAYRDYQSAQDDADEHLDSEDLAEVVEKTQAAYEISQAEKRTLAVSLDDDTLDLVDDLVLAQADYDVAVTDFLAELEGSNAHQHALILNAAWAKYLNVEESLTQAQLDLYHLLVVPDAEDISAAQSRLDAAQATIDLLSVTAPFDGEILVVNYQPGDMVSAGEIAVVLANRYPITVEAQVDESEIGTVSVGNSATVSLDMFSERSFDGMVTLINPVGRTISGIVKYAVEITLDEADTPLLLGATAEVTIQTGAPAVALAVPFNAIQSDSQGEYVNKMLADDSHVRVDIVSGEMLGDQVLIHGDLRPGDSVQLVQVVSSSAGIFGMGGQ